MDGKRASLDGHRPALPVSITMAATTRRAGPQDGRRISSEEKTRHWDDYARPRELGHLL